MSMPHYKSSSGNFVKGARMTLSQQRVNASSARAALLVLTRTKSKAPGLRASLTRDRRPNSRPPASRYFGCWSAGLVFDPDFDCELGFDCE
jgi:hypothetical protein